MAQRVVVQDGLVIFSSSDPTTVDVDFNVLGQITVTKQLSISGALSLSGDAGTAGYVLTSAGPGLPPIWDAVSVTVSEPAAQIVYGTGLGIDSSSNFTYTVSTNTLSVNAAVVSDTGAIDIRSSINLAGFGQSSLSLASPSAGLASIVSLTGGDSTTAAAGGNVNILGGSSTSVGTGGNITISSGDSATGTGGETTILGGNTSATPGAAGTGNASLAPGTNGTGDATGDVAVGAQTTLAPAATNGFVYIPTMSGTGGPTNPPTPGASLSGTVMTPMVFSPTDNTLYIWNGAAWRKVVTTV